MEVLIVEPLDPDVLDWLSARHPVVYAPHLAHDPAGLRDALAQARALVIPPSVALDAALLRSARRLLAVGRLSAGAENIDLEACALAGIEVLRPSDSSSLAEAEFAVGALLQMLRRVPVVAADGLLVGRELGSAVVGLIGCPASARPLARLLSAFGTRVIGYDPAMHMSDPLWGSWGIEALPLRDVLAQSDGLCVLLSYFSRYQGLLGERQLADCKPSQVIFSLVPSGIFDERALARALAQRRIVAAWFDGLEPGTLDPGRALHGVTALQVTPRVAATTQESRRRSARSVAERIDEVLRQRARRGDFRVTTPGGLAGRAAGPEPA